MIRKSLLALLLLFVLSSGVCLAQPIYTMNHQELTRLEEIFNLLEQNNNEQEQRLKKANELLAKQDQQMILLNEKLTRAEQSINQTQIYLLKAEQSLDKLNKDHKKEVTKLKIERNLAILGMGLLAFK